MEDDQQIVKPKRGRKPKNQNAAADLKQISDDQDQQDGDIDASSVGTKSNVTANAAKSRRGRKPKLVFNIDNPELMATNSDDENIIMRLNVKKDIEDEISKIGGDDGMFGAELPNAYDHFVADSFQSKPCEVDFTNDASLLQEDESMLQNNTIGVAKPPSHHQETAHNLKVIELLKDFEEKNKNNEWPSTTSIHCYWCCHKFDTPPFGIPVKYVDGKFHVYGCFCSLECAAAYNFSSKESMDEVWERYNLINLLSKMIKHQNIVKPAPNRLALKIFGGHLDINDFRTYCKTSKIININFPPMMTLTQQIEEINQGDINSDFKYIPIDTDRINKYKEKIKLKRTKPLTNFENTLDHTMNLKFGA